MTAPTPLSPHQDPTAGTANHVTVIEHVTTLVATLDRRFDSLHQDLKDHIIQRFVDVNAINSQQFRDQDLRYQQRFDAQTKALDAALAAAKEAVTTALTAAEKATTKAEIASDKRFDSVNEFRQTLSDQAHTFIPRAESEARMNSIIDKIDDLKATQAACESRSVIIPALDARMSEMMLEIRGLRESRSATEGKSSGMSTGWGYIVGGVSLIVVVVNVIIALATR